MTGLLLAFGAAALDAPQWPPPEAQAARMRELQEAISARDSTPGQREAARRELGQLLKAPGSTPPPKAPARAAIQPFPSIASPAVPALKAPPVDPGDVAKLEVVGPSRAIVNPSTGAPVMPLGSTVVDTRTGRMLTETPSGWIDPVTGRLIPR